LVGVRCGFISSGLDWLSLGVLASARSWFLLASLAIFLERNIVLEWGWLIERWVLHKYIFRMKKVIIKGWGF